MAPQEFASIGQQVFMQVADFSAYGWRYSAKHFDLANVLAHVTYPSTM
jgi:hypothetical protein